MVCRARLCRQGSLAIGQSVRLDTAQKILVVYGTLSIGYGFALGIPISQVRMRSPEASRHLVIAHLSAIIQGAVHLGLSVALGLSQLTAWLETASALLLITGSALSWPEGRRTGSRALAITSPNAPLAGNCSQQAASGT